MTTNTYADQQGYEGLSKFTNIEEFNSQFEQAMLDVKERFTKSEYIALNKLRKYAADVVGVAWCKAQSAVAETHKDELFGISRSSFDRMLRKAKKFNLITVINQYRENKKQKHNVYVFNRVEDLQLEEVEIVSKSHTIDVPMAIEEPRTNNLFELTKEKQVKDNNNTPVSELENNEQDQNQENNEQPLAIEEQREYVDTYATNEYQVETFKLIETMPMANEIKEKAHIIALRVGSNATIKDFIHAKTVLLNMSVSIAEGTEFANIVGAFTSAFNKSKSRPKQTFEPKKETPISERKVPFYNWVKERSHASGRSIRNWITGDK